MVQLLPTITLITMFIKCLALIYDVYFKPCKPRNTTRDRHCSNPLHFIGVETEAQKSDLF